MGTNRISKLQAHIMVAENYQRFVIAGIPDWYEFSTQFNYAKAWADNGNFTPAEGKDWKSVVLGDVDLAASFKANGFTPETAAPWIAKTTYTAEFCAQLAKAGKRPGVVTQPKPQRTR